MTRRDFKDGIIEYYRNMDIDELGKLGIRETITKFAKAFDMPKEIAYSLDPIISFIAYSIYVERSRSSDVTKRSRQLNMNSEKKLYYTGYF